mmetsp:Transcript_33654/g.76273  ORF Transcript_33654/g.76273 Transcript_33654/m.76273 type:complete len:331 (-) Transcript_33654:943-1935(-)
MCVLVRPLASPLALSPRVAATDEFVALCLDALQDGVAVPTDKPGIKGGLTALPAAFLLASLWREMHRQEEPPALHVLESLKHHAGVLFARSPFVRLDRARLATKEVEDRLVREAAIAHLVASVKLAECLLDEGNPHLLGVLGMRKDNSVILVHWHVIVDEDVCPLAVHVEPDAEDARLDVVLQEGLPESVVAVAHDRPQGAEQEAGAYLALDDVAGADASLEDHCVLDEFGVPLVCMRLGHGAVVPRLLFVHVEASLRILGQVEVGVGVLRSVFLKLLDDIVDHGNADLAISVRPGGGVHQGWGSHDVFHHLDHFCLLLHVRPYTLLLNL